MKIWDDIDGDIQEPAGRLLPVPVKLVACIIFANDFMKNTLESPGIIIYLVPRE